MARNGVLISHMAEIKEGKGSTFTCGYGCVIHPKAKISIGDNCKLILGEYNIIEEGVEIIVKPKKSGVMEGEEAICIYIGGYNHFKVGAYLENTTVENDCVIGFKAHLKNINIPCNCIISPTVHLEKDSMDLQENQIILPDFVSVNNLHFVKEEHERKIKELRKITEIAFAK